MKNKTRDFSIEIRPYIPKIKQLALKLCGNSNDAKDLIQEALIKIYPMFFTLDPTKNINAWIARVTYNTYVDLWRKQQNHQKLHVTELQNCSELTDESITEICPCLLLEMNEQQRKTTELLYQLKNDYRILLIMHDIEGFTLNELSIIFCENAGTIKSRLHRARKKFRELLKKENIQQSEYVA